jgi:hypothetical protein
LNRAVTQRAPVKAFSGYRSREAADRLAIERGEDDGMIVHQGASPAIHNSKDFNDITTR